jgi:hypothetical protein
VAVKTRHHTVVQRVRGDGSVERSRLIRGAYGIPGAAYDGSNTGLSFDERTLVVAPMRPSAKATRLLVLDGRSLRPRATIVLPGYFTVDAVSPDGHWLYLIHYRSVADNDYEVRAYDLRARQLLAKPIVDPREPDEKMLGMPFARTMSHDGRWAYTYYDRPDEAPFIHALDTRGATAACIDLDDLIGTDPSSIKLVAPRGDGPLRVVNAAGTQALVNRRTFAVSRPPDTTNTPNTTTAPARPATATRDGDGPPWAVLAGALAVLLALAGGSAARRRYARSASLRNAS